MRGLEYKHVYELMVGDHLQYVSGEYCVVVALHEKEDKVAVSFIDEKGITRYSTLLPTTDFSPIPLTAAILEKNGFVKQAYDGWLLYADDYSIEWRTDTGVPWLIIDSWHCDYGVFHKNWVVHVHQLQHALRLCGIDKEITI